jgi:ATP-binding cassette, subfamily B, bacterial
VQSPTQATCPSGRISTAAGGSFVISGTLKIGTLVSVALLISRLYGPISQLSNIQVSFLTALVSFDRVFEVLDLKPLIAE